MVYKNFLDTDVIIDFLIDRQSHAASSTELFSLSEIGLTKIYVSSLCINNVYYIVKKVLGDKKARSVIEELLEFMEVLTVEKSDLQSAIKSPFNDFEDAIQHAVALKEKEIKSIITRNTKDYKKSKLAVFTPDTFLKTIKNEG